MDEHQSVSHIHGNVGNQVGSQTIHGNVYNRFGSWQASSTGTASENSSNHLKDENILQSLAFPEMFDRRNNIEQHHPLTCRWIFDNDQYLSWKQKRNGLCWIKGKPGSGKSTLMTALHDDMKQLRKIDDTIVYLDFYFNARGTELQHTALGMCRSLMNQLFTQSEPARVILRAHCEEKYAAFGSFKTELKWHRAELERLFAKAVLETARQQHVEIFVDALDEAGKSGAQELVVYYHNLCNNFLSSSANIKICISCRHYPVATTKGSSEIWVEKHNQDDISQFVRDTFVRMDAVTEDVPDDSKDWSELQEEIIERARGVFQWTRLVLQLVQTLFDDGNSVVNVRHKINDVPQELSETYEYIIENVIDPRSREKSFSLFRWVCLAAHPFSLTQMRYALAAEKIPIPSAEIRMEDIEEFISTDRQMEKQVVSLSGGLLEVFSGHLASRRSNIKNIMLIQVTHQSVNDYLYTRGLSLLYNMYIQDNIPSELPTSYPDYDFMDFIECCHSELYWTCLKYIAVQDTAFWEELSTIALDESDEDADRAALLVLEHFPLAEHATDYMIAYALGAGALRSDDSKQEVALLTKAIPVWRQLLRIVASDLDQEWAQTTITVLHFAAHVGLRDLLNWLLQKNTDIYCIDGKRYSAMAHAALGGHLLCMQDLYRYGVPLRDNSWERNPLNIAATNGHAEIVTWLLQQDARLVHDPEFDEKSLQATSSSGSKKLVLLLLDNGLDVRQSYSMALCTASRFGFTEIVKMLLDAGADVNQVAGINGTALWMATAGGHSKIVNILLDAGADVNQSGEHYGTPLQRACIHGHDKIVEILLDGGADVNDISYGHDTALRSASSRGSAKIVRMLLDARADVNLTSGYGGPSPLLAASWHGCREIIKMLLDAGADVNLTSGNEGSALCIASGRGNGNVVKMLLDAGADLNKAGEYEGTALHNASAGGHSEVVKVLLNAGADLHLVCGVYYTVLQAASQSGDEKTVKMLLDAGADVNQVAGIYGTALWMATAGGHSKIVKILLDAGANVHEPHSSGFARDTSALTSQSEEIEELLVNAGAEPLPNRGFH